MRPRLLKERIVPLALLAIVAGLFLYSSRLREMFLWVASLLRGYSAEQPTAAVLVFMALAAASATFSLFTSTPLIPIAVTIWGKGWTVVMLLGGWVIGGVGAYAIGRYAGYPLLKRFLPEDAISFYRSKLSSRSEFLFVFLFRFIFPAEITGYVLGILRYHLGKYVIITFLSELPFAVLAVFISEAFITANQVMFWSLGVLAAALFLGFVYFFQKRLKR